MIKEYIPKDELEQALRKEAARLLRYYKRYMSVSEVVNELIGVVQRFPAAEVAPVVHSYWEHKIANDGENIAICHNCKYPVSWFWEQTPYCVNCWAKMDLEEPNEPDKREG